MITFTKGEDVKFAHTEEQATIFANAGWVKEVKEDAKPKKRVSNEHST